MMQPEQSEPHSGPSPNVRTLKQIKVSFKVSSQSRKSEFRVLSVVDLNIYIVGSMGAPSKVFLLFFLLPDCLRLNHLKSRMECGFQTFFAPSVAETIGMTNYTASFAVQKTTFEAAEMMLGPWRQQYNF